MTKYIGIYNRYWNSLGGGEKYTGSIAEILSQLPNVDVCLIGTEPFSTAQLGQRLSLDLSRCRTALWPDVYDQQTALTRGYDLFINSTYCSSLPCRARRAAYVCFFPHELDPGYPIHTDSTRRWLRRQPGISNFAPASADDGEWPLGGNAGFEADWHWFGSLAALRIPDEARSGRWLRLPARVACGHAISRVAVNGCACVWQFDGESLRLRLPIPWCIAPAASWDIFIETPATSSAPALAIGTRAIGLRSYTRQSSPQASTEGGEAWLETYDSIVAISYYTAEWVARRWSKPSVIHTPSVDTVTFTPGDGRQPRDRIILSVGRFFAGGHNKKHDVLIKVFRTMVDQGRLPAGWRLVLAGARHIEHTRHLDYYANLQALAHGYQIEFRPDIPREELINLYRSASIYWHASGFGESETDHPELFEHFGITTCEAMACGLLPVVIAQAGQKEIVADGITGYTFSTEEELAGKTLRAIGDLSTSRGLELCTAARASLVRYSTKAFRQRTEHFFGDLL